MVGNGSPASSYGACSVTAGAPNGQRTATRRNARGAAAELALDERAVIHPVRS